MNCKRQSVARDAVDCRYNDNRTASRNSQRAAENIGRAGNDVPLYRLASDIIRIAKLIFSAYGQVLKS